MRAVSMNSKAIYINGKATTLLCASLFYFRIPRQEWEKRMEQLNQLGYNCIDVYMPWNFHELYPGQWCFEEMHDVAAFLKLAAEHGLYVIARPGPYICSEWDGGALPAWLSQQKLPLRQNNDKFLRSLYGWLAKIIPVIAQHQVGQGGSVVALQLENELDFFACQDPKGYMDKLIAHAKALGITVPITACSGECDVQGACGWSQEAHPTFNAYSAFDYPMLEQQLGHMRGLAARADTPLMITETDREHDKMKRELVSGARLIAPYNQVGGTDVDMTNGVSNWSGDYRRPYAYMATDYDFNSAITVDGRFRPDALKGRLLGSLLATFGELLAEGEPADAPTGFQADFRCPLRLDDSGRQEPFFPALRLSCGYLLGATNLDTRAGALQMETPQGTRCMSLAPGETRLLPWRLSLAPWGCSAVLLWAECEIAEIVRRDEKVYITTAGEGSLCMENNSEVLILQGQAWQAAGADVYVRVLPTQEAARSCSLLPPLVGSVPTEIRTSICVKAIGERFTLVEHASDRGGRIAPMEALGQYRGDVIYRFRTEGEGPLLLVNGADLIWAENQRGCMAFAGDGSTRLVEGCQGLWQVRVQSWGHANFDDHSQPALVMGSTRGLNAVAEVVTQEDISALWRILPTPKYAVQANEALRQEDHILATTIDSWSYAVRPFHAELTRRVFFREDCDSFFLHLPNEGPMIEVWLDDQLIGSRQSNDPYVELTAAQPGTSALLRLKISRVDAHEPVGAVALLSARRVQAAETLGVTPEEWAAVRPSGNGRDIQLPLALRPGEELLLSDFLPQGTKRSRMLVLDGAGVEATLVAHGHVCGRAVLKTPGYPDAKGGSSRRIFLPEEWTDSTVCLHLCGIGDGGQLRAIQFEEVL